MLFTVFLYTCFTTHDYDYVGDIEYQVMFSVLCVTLP